MIPGVAWMTRTAALSFRDHVRRGAFESAPWVRSAPTICSSRRMIAACKRGEAGRSRDSVNNLAVERLVEAFQVRNFQGAHGLDRPAQRVIGAATLSRGSSRGPQDTQDPRPIEPLPFALLAEAHGRPSVGRISAI
jgi:hypothetical protein